MSSVRYSRLDGRKSSSSSSFLSTAMVFAFVSLCLVGVWMMNSPSSISPAVQNSGESSGTGTGTANDDVSAEAKVDKSKLVDSNENTNDNGDSNKGVDESNPPGDGEAQQNQLENNNGNVPKDEANGDANSQQQGNSEKQEFQDSNGNLPKDEAKGDANNLQEQSSGGKQNQFEDKNGNLPKDATNGDASNQQEQSSGSGGEQNQFEDNNGNLPKDATNGDVNNQQAQSSASLEKEKRVENNQEEKPVEEKKEDSKAKSADEENKSGTNSSEKKSEESSGQMKDGKMGTAKTKQQQQVEEENDKQLNQGSAQKKDSEETNNGQSSTEVYPSGEQTGLLKETNAQNGSFSTQAQESKKEKEAKKAQESWKDSPKPSGQEKQKVYSWKLCRTTAQADYIPCLDNLDAIRHLRSTKHYEHRERHCPKNPPTCLVPLPEGYKTPIQWPTSRDKIWYHNVPHTKLVEYKGNQNWVKVSGEYLVFPGGGTQFQHGALHYIDVMQKSVPEISWGKRTRVILDVGCGVASFGGYLFEKDVLTMSIAPKDEHEAQVQFALERGIPAMSAVMGTKRLPFPGNVFDIVHCARCRVPWHIEGGKLLLELNRLLRPGGFFVWSATPVYRKNSEDVEIWEAMKKLTKSMCWEQVKITRDKMNGVGIAFYRKPVNNQSYEQRKQNQPPLCPEVDDPNAAWNVSLQACMHKVPVAATERGSKWPERWPARLEKAPYWLPRSQVGVYGKPAPQDLAVDTKHWKNVVQNSYLNGMGINWSTVRNVMDMRSVYGGFAAALRGMKVWVMNIVTIDDPDTLPIIYERGLFGVYHDWCESFSTYPRTYDLLHANHLFSMIKKKCNYMGFIAEVDRILRPGGKLLVRDSADTITELESLLRSMHWEIRMTFSENKEGFLCAQKTMWRPQEFEMLAYAMDKA